jgi:RNA recognition motif-containing protein
MEANEGARERSPDRKDDRRRDSSGARRSGGPGGFVNRPKGGNNPRRAPPERRIFVSNIPFEMKWQEVKDLFRDNVGDVSYVELFNDENEKPRGCGILEFATEEMAKNAVEKMHRHEYKGRKFVVKEDFDTERDRYGRITKGPRGGERDDRNDRDRDDRRDHSVNRSGGGGRGGGGGGGGGGGAYGNTYGLSPQFLESLGIDGPLHTRLFVANLSYSVDERKLREVFRLAGRVVMVELNRDKEGKSRGHAVVEYDHPVEAVQAISMFNDQSLFDRKITARFDKSPGPSPEELAQLPSRLPEGLGGVGMGLGSGGNPLTEVAKNLPSSNNGQSNNAASMNNMGGSTGGINVTDLANTLAVARQLGMNLGGGNNGIGNLAGALSGII